MPRPSGMKRLLQAAFAASCLLLGGFAAAQEGLFHAEMSGLAEERGCTFCHREGPAAEANGALPLAPSWREIATRYRGRVGAVAEARALARWILSYR